MREVLDEQSTKIIRVAYKAIFSLLQRACVLREFLFLEEYYLVSIDGTGHFSSSKIRCENCCKKEHRNGTETYYHQMMAAAIVHPDQKVVIPFAPEPIKKLDGEKKNDCERNATKRWLVDFRQEHPHLPVMIVADGLSSNGPFIKMLREYRCNFIIVCQESDHKYLTEWINAADKQDAPVIEETAEDGTKIKYQYMNCVPINDSHTDCQVNVVRYWAENPKTGGTSHWMWVTDVKVTKDNVRELARGGRSRWRIENETFNTLKNQGYNFEHNFGHGNKNLSTMLSFEMLLAFLIDQCLQKLNKLFQEAYAKCGAKYALWERMRAVLIPYIMPSFEKMYEVIVHPPPIIDLSGVMLP
jgi:hypothetical protein